MENEMITQSTLKREYGLTDRQIRMIGEPDALKPNPQYRNASPMKLYQRERIEAWIAENSEDVRKSDQQKAAAQKAVETKRQLGKAKLLELLESLRLEKIKNMEKVRNEASLFFLKRYSSDSELSEKALCSFIRHRYTNYEHVLAQIKGKVGVSELYKNAKLYLCCRIIEHYQLNLDPLIAAFGEKSTPLHLKTINSETILSAILQKIEQ